MRGIIERRCCRDHDPNDPNDHSDFAVSDVVSYCYDDDESDHNVLRNRHDLWW